MDGCGGWDSNPRTPTRLGPQPSAFDLAGQPPQGVRAHRFLEPFVNKSMVDIVAGDHNLDMSVSQYQRIEAFI